MALLGPGAKQLKGLRKSDERKLLLAGRLKKHFCVTHPWLSAHLHMGHPTRVSRASAFHPSVPRKWSATRLKLEDSLRVAD